MATFKKCLAIVVVLLGPGHLALSAEPFPNEKIITLVSSMDAGGAADTAVRALSGEWAKDLGQSFVHVTRVGAAGTIAGRETANAKPDGYTITALVSTGAVPEIYRFFREAHYSSADLKPVGRIGEVGYGLFVDASSPYKTLGDFIAATKADPQALNYGHAGAGHIYHLLMTAVLDRAGTHIVDIPYTGGSPIAVALLGGHIKAAMMAVSNARSFVDAGKMRMLAVEASERLSWAPETPTFKELGYDFGLAPWYVSLFVPVATPDDVVNKLARSLKKAVESPEYKAVVDRLGIIPQYGSPSDVKADIQTDKTVIDGLLKQLKMSK